VVEEIGTKSPLYPALVAPESKLPVKVTPANAGLELCVRETEKDVFVLACKREGDTKQFRFSGLPVEAAEGEVLFESPRNVAVKDGSWTDWFGPFEVHVYRFSKR
jgi:hypothetical protein